MDMREFKEMLIKSMENACDDSLQSDIDDGEVFDDEEEIADSIFNDIGWVIDRMREDWEKYNGGDFNREIVEDAYTTDMNIYDVYDIMSAYCKTIIDEHFDNWVDKTTKALKGEI